LISGEYCSNVISSKVLERRPVRADFTDQSIQAIKQRTTCTFTKNYNNKKTANRITFIEAAMEEKDLEYFTQLLNTQLAELENRTKYTDIREMTQNNGLQDPLDIASSDMEKNMLLRIRERESRLISKIKQALELIAEGTYGTCEICGDDIPVKRLEARPVTTQCIECKTREELIERIRQNK